jgi:DNA-binding Lrp family transcriptional regulator
MTIEVGFCLNKIQKIWQSKEYRSLPVAVSTHFRQQSPLSDGAVICWQTLFEMAFFNEEWSVQISKKDLAIELNKSPATVARLLKELGEGHYISREATKINNVHYASRIFVRLPDSLIKELEQAPDRRKPKINTVIPLPTQAREMSKIKPVIPNNSKFYVELNDNNEQNSFVKINKGPVQKREGGYIKNETTNKNNNINNKYILNNNANCASKTKIVVDDKKGKEEKENLKMRIKQLGDNIQNFYEYQAKATCPDERLSYFQKIRQLGAIQTALEQDLHQLARKKEAKAKHYTLPYLAASGNRPLAPHQAERLKMEVARLTQDADKQKQTINEIAYAVRFGNLQVSYQSHEAVSVEHALNIALKLLRENRWETPKGMRQAA